MEKLNEMQQKKDDYLEHVTILHSHLSEELKREDGKSERLFTLITAILTALIIASVYFMVATIEPPLKGMIASALFCNIFFQFISLVVSGTALFDLVYSKDFVFRPFGITVFLIGELLLGQTDDGLKKYRKLHTEKDKLMRKVASNESSNFLHKLYQFYQKDNEWKCYLISIKCSGMVKD